MKKLSTFLILGLTCIGPNSSADVYESDHSNTADRLLNSTNLIVFHKEANNGTLFQDGEMTVLETDTVLSNPNPYCFISSENISSEKQQKFYVGYDNRIYSVETTLKDKSIVKPSIIIGFGRSTDPDSISSYAHALVCIFGSRYEYHSSSIIEHIDRITGGAVKIEGYPRSVESINLTCNEDPTCA